MDKAMIDKYMEDQRKRQNEVQRQVLKAFRNPKVQSLDSRMDSIDLAIEVYPSVESFARIMFGEGKESDMTESEKQMLAEFSESHDSQISAALYSQACYLEKSVGKSSVEK